MLGAASGCASDLTQRRFLQDYVLSVAVSPDGQWVVSGSKDRSIQFWNIATGQAQFMLQGHKNSGKLDGPTSLLDSLRCLTVRCCSHLHRSRQKRKSSSQWERRLSSENMVVWSGEGMSIATPRGFVVV